MKILILILVIIGLLWNILCLHYELWEGLISFWIPVIFFLIIGVLLPIVERPA